MFKMENVMVFRKGLWNNTKTLVLYISSGFSMIILKTTNGCNAQLAKTGCILSVPVWRVTGHPKISSVDATLLQMCKTKLPHVRLISAIEIKVTVVLHLIYEHF